MNWSINIPFKDRDDPVWEIGLCARDLPEDERAVVRQLTMDAVMAGTETCGDFLDELEGLSEPERRQRLDDARRAVDLPSATELDQRREQRLIDARFNDADIPPPPRWEGEWQQCHAPNCNTFPANEAGVPTKVSCERWFCPEHEGLAQEGDLEEHQPAYIGFEFGRLIPSEKEKARVAAEIAARDEPMEEERRQREEHARREHEAIAEARQHYADTTEVSVAGVRVRPDQWSVK